MRSDLVTVIVQAVKISVTLEIVLVFTYEIISFCPLEGLEYSVILRLLFFIMYHT